MPHSSNHSQRVLKPELKPERPYFSSGPCAKRPGWSLEVLAGALLGRSHRASVGRARLKEVITRSKEVLNMPPDWRLGIVPASDTGAVEMILWALGGQRGIDVLSFESFSDIWAKDLSEILELEDVRVLSADYGALPDFSEINWARDVVFPWNGTTSGVCVPHQEMIPQEHEGLVICDATSAVFAMDLPWDRLDIVTWSWQKVLGGEAAHGMLALSPRAVKRLEEGVLRPLPKIFRLTNQAGLIEAIFEGDTINTPSMLCVEDALDGLRWAKKIGGLEALKARSLANLKIVSEWVETCPWVAFLCEEEEKRSCTSICLKIISPWFLALSESEKSKAIKYFTSLCEEEKVGYDLASYRDAPAGLRIWGGATIEGEDIKRLLPWLEWAYCQTEETFKKKDLGL